MKKTIFLLLILSIIFILPACSKTDVDVALEDDRKAEDELTEEDYENLSNEDPEFQEDYINTYEEAIDENISKEKMDLIDELEASKTDKKTGKGSIGSCDMIAESSTCIEYYGSFWTTEQIQLGCENGIYSSKPCPTGSIGGCNTGVETVADMVARLYLIGGGDITADSQKYAQNACDATFMSNWISR